MRETTNNDNGSDGTTIQSMKVIMKLRLNTRGITQSKANNEDLSSNAMKWPLRHASSKVLKGSSYVIFLDNELKLRGSDWLKEGNDESPIINTKQGINWNNFHGYRNNSNNGYVHNCRLDFS